MAAPTLASSAQSAWTSTTSPKTVSVTVAIGDVLVVKGVKEESSGNTMSTPTGGTGFTWTLQQSHVVNSWTGAWVWTATATAAQTFTLSVAATGPGVWGFAVERWTGSTGIGASAKVQSTGAPSMTLTTTGANSAISAVMGDWNATTGTATYRTINGFTPAAGGVGETGARPGDGATYGAYSCYWTDAGTAGGKVVGQTAPSTQKYSLIAVEVLGNASSSTTGSASLAVTATVTSAATRGRPGSGELAVTVTPTASVVAGRQGGASLAVSATLSAEATASHPSTGSASLSVTATLTADATRTASGASPTVRIVDVTAAPTAATAQVRIVEVTAIYHPEPVPQVRIMSVGAEVGETLAHVRIVGVSAVNTQIPQVVISAVFVQALTPPTPFDIFKRVDGAWASPLIWVRNNGLWVDVSTG